LGLGQPHLGQMYQTPRLATLVKRVTELHESSLWARHCAEEFTLRWIHPLGHREKLAYECPWLADPSRESTAGRILILLSVADDMSF
jgi:hypothetical protein